MQRAIVYRCVHVDAAGKQCDDERPTKHGAWMHFQRAHVANWSTKVTLLPGALDPGEREIVRKRLLYTIGELSAQLERHPRAVLDAAMIVAGDRFERSVRRAVAR